MTLLKRDLAGLAESQFDLAVIGGGIYGACIAREAALRGLAVALVEQVDFGHATSANSMKTVHGGLRYLQSFDIGRMRRSSGERTSLMRIAPHLVHPLPCIMPVYGHGIKGREVMSAALFLNDLISYDRNEVDDPEKHLPRGSVVSRDECARLLPGIATEGLSGGAIWYDAQMYNSERLTLSFILSAVENGAQVANYARVTGLLQEANRVNGLEVVDQLTGQQFCIRAQTVVNAAGPWIDRVLNLLPDEDVRLGVRLAKAVNVATRPIFEGFAVGVPARTPRNGSGSSSERLLFVSPWRNQSLIGTTYELYDEDPDSLRVTEDDVGELLRQINAIYAPASLSLDDVICAYCGLVPVSNVDAQTGRFKRAGQYRIRDHEADGYAGLISVLGVKYTTARSVAEEVVDHVQKVRGEKGQPSRSDRIPLHGGDIEHFETFMESALGKRPLELSPLRLQPLLYNYGTAYGDVLNYVPSLAWTENSLSEERAILIAQIVYGVRHEMAQKLADVIFRRTEIGTSGHPGSELLEFCADVMADEMGWSDVRRKEEVQAVEEMFVLPTGTSQRWFRHGRNLARTPVQ